jgi:hypothetical protein
MNGFDRHMTQPVGSDVLDALLAAISEGKHE